MIAYPLSIAHWSTTFLNGHPCGKPPISVQAQICPSVGAIVRHIPIYVDQFQCWSLKSPSGLHLCCDYISMTIPWYPPVIHGDIMGYIGDIVTMYVDLWLDPAICLGPQELRIEQLGRSAGLVHHGSYGSVASVVPDVIENGPIK